VRGIKICQVFIVYLLLFALLIPVGYDEIRNILVSLGLISFVVIQKRVFEFQWDKVRILLFLFIFYSYASYCWATNPSLVWNESTNYLLLVLLFITVSYCVNVDKNIVKLLSGILLVSFICINLVFIVSLVLLYLPGMSISRIDWQAVFGENNNMVAAYTVLHLPLLAASDLRKRWKIVLLASTLLLIYNSGAVGAGLGLFLLFLLYLFIKLKVSNIVSFLCIVILFISVGFIVDVSSWQSVRLELVYASIDLWLSTPLYGVGADNWYTEIYSYIKNNELLHYYDEIIRIKSHNYPLKILTEYGLVGGILFYGPIFFILIGRPDRVTQPYWMIVVVYLFLSTIYSGSFYQAGYSSRLQYLSFISLGIIYGTATKSARASLKTMLFLIIVCIFSLVWYVYYAFQVSRHSSLRETVALEKIVSPGVFTGVNEKNSIYEQLGVLYWNKGDQELAKYNLIKANELLPGDLKLNLLLARLFLYNGNLKKANEYFEVVRGIDSSFIGSEMLGAELNVILGNSRTADSLLDSIWDSEFKHAYLVTLNLIEEELFHLKLKKVSFLPMTSRERVLRIVNSEDLRTKWISLLNAPSAVDYSNVRGDLREYLVQLDEDIRQLYRNVAKEITDKELKELITYRFEEIVKERITKYLLNLNLEVVKRELIVDLFTNNFIDYWCLELLNADKGAKKLLLKNYQMELENLLFHYKNKEKWKRQLNQKLKSMIVKY